MSTTINNTTPKPVENTAATEDVEPTGDGAVGTGGGAEPVEAAPEGGSEEVSGSETLPAGEQRVVEDRRTGDAADSYVGPERRSQEGDRRTVIDPGSTGGVTLADAPSIAGATRPRGPNNATTDTFVAPDVNVNEMLNNEDNGARIQAFLGVKTTRTVSTPRTGTVVAPSSTGTGGISDWRQVGLDRLYPDIPAEKALVTVTTLNAVAQLRAERGSDWMPSSEQDIEDIHARASALRDHPAARTASGDAVPIILPGRVQARAFSHIFHGERMPQELVNQLAETMGEQFVGETSEIVDEALEQRPGLWGALKSGYDAIAEGAGDIRDATKRELATRVARDRILAFQEKHLDNWNGSAANRTRFGHFKAETENFLSTPPPSRTRRTGRPATTDTPVRTATTGAPVRVTTQALRTTAAEDTVETTNTPDFSISLAEPFRPGFSLTPSLTPSLTSPLFSPTPSLTDGFNFDALTPTDAPLLGPRIELLEDNATDGVCIAEPFSIDSLDLTNLSLTDTPAAEDPPSDFNFNLSLTPAFGAPTVTDPWNLGLTGTTLGTGLDSPSLSLFGAGSSTGFSLPGATPSFVGMPNEPFDNWGLGPGPWNQRTLDSARASWERKTFGTTLSPTPSFGGSLLSSPLYSPLLTPSLLDPDPLSLSSITGQSYLTNPMLGYDPLMSGFGSSSTSIGEFDPTSFLTIESANEVFNISGNYSDSFRDSITAPEKNYALSSLSQPDLSDFFYEPVISPSKVAYSYTDVEVSAGGFLESMASPGTDGDRASRQARRASFAQSVVQQREARQEVQQRQIARAEGESRETNNFVENVAEARVASKERDVASDQHNQEGAPRKDRGPRGLA